MANILKEEPLVSIIMNCFNGEHYLDDALKSVLDQTYKNWELIFWDNKSADNSRNIFKKFNDSRFKYFLSEKHTTLYEARNSAIQKAQGEFLAFLDTDDIWLKDKLKKQIPLFEDNSVGLVYGNFWLFNKSNIIRKKRIFSKDKLEKGIITEPLLKNYTVGLLTIVIRKKFLSNLKEVFNPKYDVIADFDFVIKFSANYKFNCIQDAVAIYRQHEKQLSKKLFNNQIEQLKDCVSNIKLNSKINFLNLKFIECKIKYMEIVKLIYEKKMLESLLLINRYPFSLNKIKLIVILILPKKILKFLRNYT